MFREQYVLAGERLQFCTSAAPAAIKHIVRPPHLHLGLRYRPLKLSEVEFRPCCEQVQWSWSCSTKQADGNLGDPAGAKVGYSLRNGPMSDRASIDSAVLGFDQRIAKGQARVRRHLPRRDGVVKHLADEARPSTAVDR